MTIRGRNTYTVSFDEPGCEEKYPPASTDRTLRPNTWWTAQISAQAAGWIDESDKDYCPAHHGNRQGPQISLN